MIKEIKYLFYLVVLSTFIFLVINYYFSDYPLKANEQFHVTSFRGRPEQKIRDTILQANNLLRMIVRKVFPKGLIKTNHIYK